MFDPEIKAWKTGSNKEIEFSTISEQILLHSLKDRKIFIGSDSFISQNKTCFVTAVCLLTKNLGGRYFFYKERVPTRYHRSLPLRITEEVRRSIEIAEHFIQNFNVRPTQIELHLDVSPPTSKNGTSRFSEMLKGYVQGFGLTCKLKPDAWASQSVADRHSK